MTAGDYRIYDEAVARAEAAEARLAVATDALRAALAWDADLSEYCDGPLRDAFRTAARAVLVGGTDADENSAPGVRLTPTESGASLDAVTPEASGAGHD